MSWFAYALIAVFFFTLLDLMQRKIAVSSKNPREMAVAFNGGAALISLIIFFVTGAFRNVQLPAQPIAWLGLVGVVICYGLFERGRFFAAKALEASVFATIINISLIIVMVGSFLFLGENVTSQKLVGAALIIVASVLVTYEKKAKATSPTVKGVLIGVLVSLFVGAAWLFDKQNTQYFAIDIYALLVWSFPLFIIVFPKIKLKALQQELQIFSWRILCMSFLNVCGYWCVLQALHLADASRVFPIVQTCILTTVVAGIIFLRERDDMGKKILAAVLALVGVLMVL